MDLKNFIGGNNAKNSYSAKVVIDLERLTQSKILEKVLGKESGSWSKEEVSRILKQARINLILWKDGKQEENKILISEPKNRQTDKGGFLWRHVGEMDGGYLGCQFNDFRFLLTSYGKKNMRFQFDLLIGEEMLGSSFSEFFEVVSMRKIQQIRKQRSEYVRPSIHPYIFIFFIFF